MTTSSQSITLAMDHGGHGAMTQECVRALLHTANPSCALKYVLKGVRQYKKEVQTSAPINDLKLLEEVEAALITLWGQVHAREEEMYGSNEPHTIPHTASQPLAEPTTLSFYPPVAAIALQKVSMFPRDATPTRRDVPSLAPRAPKATRRELPAHKAAK
jgi:hypothetical protein